MIGGWRLEDWEGCANCGVLLLLLHSSFGNYYCNGRGIDSLPSALASYDEGNVDVVWTSVEWRQWRVEVAAAF